MRIPESLTPEQTQEMQSLGWWHTIELARGVFTQGEIVPNADAMGMPADLTGKSVLDIGCWDGYYAFEAEKRGAQPVVAIDNWQNPGPNRGQPAFDFAHRVLESDVEFHPFGLFEMPDATGQAFRFDLVLFLGVLYHLDQPLRGLKIVSDLTREIAIVETAISALPGAVFELKPKFRGDPCNYTFPSVKGLEVALKMVGFAGVELVAHGGTRITVKAYK